MERKIINPWTWQDQYGFVQANEVSGAGRTLICSGQTAIDAEGNLAHAGDIAAQLKLSLDNLETVLEQAGFSLADVVRMTIHTTDVDALLEAWPTLVGRLKEGECRASQALLGVARLAFPELLVEIEATAMK
jgi:enamine deaminase RidA (YjgF/YER057c/UK114 family)